MRDYTRPPIMGVVLFRRASWHSPKAILGEVYVPAIFRSLLVLILFANLPGCLLLDTPLANRGAFVQCLPPDVTLASEVTRRGILLDRKSSVEAELVRLGAKVGDDGRLYAKTGKEIRIWCPPPIVIGGPRQEQSIRAMAMSLEELESLNEHYTVIELTGTCDFDLGVFKAEMDPLQKIIKAVSGEERNPVPLQRP